VIPELFNGTSHGFLKCVNVFLRSHKLRFGSYPRNESRAHGGAENRPAWLQSRSTSVSGHVSAFAPGSRLLKEIGSGGRVMGDTTTLEDLNVLAELRDTEK